MKTMDALFACIEAQKVGMLEALLQDVKDVNVKHEETGLGLLHKAAASGCSYAYIFILGGGMTSQWKLPYLAFKMLCD